MAQDDSKFCYIALGSNMDDKLRHLSRAVQALKGLPGLSLRRTSSLYSTKAQYVSDQPAFLNAVVELELSDTRLSKIPELLIDLKQIEEELGRKPGIRRGPRVIDLDIIAVGRQTVNIQEGKYPLQVPHALMHERDFVLVPLNDLRPDWRHPALSGEPSVSELVERLKSGSGTSPDGASLDAWPVQMLPGAGGLYGKKVGQLWRRGEQTLIMGILNITPDSFSDGGDHLDPANAVRAAAEMVSAGAQILDIGGESTRPGAAEVSVEEEIRRVVPVIAGIRKAGIDATVSIDTRKAAVAKAAIQAGADWINDVSAGDFDAEMFAVAAVMLAPIVLMHMKGTPDTMNSLANYSNVVEEVTTHLVARRNAAEAAGVPSWNVILDPGIGFAKNLQHNISLLQDCARLVANMRPSPILVGASRKRFLGTILDEPDAKKRTFGNAAVTAISIAGGVDVLRVHEVGEMAQVARVCDRVYRGDRGLMSRL